jgi:hypothetical protein
VADELVIVAGVRGFEAREIGRGWLDHYHLRVIRNISSLPPNFPLFFSQFSGIFTAIMELRRE